MSGDVKSRPGLYNMGFFALVKAFETEDSLGSEFVSLTGLSY
jgi:hypothetical protein